MIYFGYTSCPDICPSTLYYISSIYRIIRNIPEDAKVYKEPCGTKLKANKVKLKKKEKWCNLKVFKRLVKEGANIHANDDYALRCASANGHLGVVKFLVSKGANIHADDDCALRCASENGHLSVVKFLKSAKE
jgi:hypothetical protein